MNALELLHNRVSSPVLEGEAPTDEQLENMLKAALRAPDHACLKPYRFLTVTGDSLSELGELFVKAAQIKDSQIEKEKLEKFRKMPMRAPMIMVAVAATKEHPKVPEVEQIITAGCATQAVIQAAFAQGLGAIWRTGDMAFDPVVKAGLGLQSHEQIIGFIYLGQRGSDKKLPVADTESIITDWTPDSA